MLYVYGRYWDLGLLDPKQDDIILDPGCGSGTQLIELARSIQYGYGGDLAEEIIQRLFVGIGNDSLLEWSTTAGFRSRGHNVRKHR